MERKYLIGSLLLAFCLFCSSGAEKKPEWVLSPETAYPGKDYIKALGEGASEKEARKEAVSQIASQFSSKVKVVNTALSDLQYAEENDKTSFSKKNSFHQDFKSVSETDLYCLNFTESYYSKKQKKYYELAYINRRLAFRVLKSKIEPLTEEINTILSSAGSEKEPLYKLFLYQKALSLGEVAKSYIDNAMVISPEQAAVFEKNLKQISEIRTLTDRQNSRITFNVTCGNRTAKELVPGLSSILEESGFVYAKKNPMYRINIDISFKEEVYEAGNFVRPSVSITVVNSSGDAVESYSKIYDRYTHGTMENSYELAVLRVQQDLEENFLYCYRD